MLRSYSFSKISTGIQNQNLEPLPTSLSTPMSPWQAVTMDLLDGEAETSPPYNNTLKRSNSEGIS